MSLVVEVNIFLLPKIESPAVACDRGATNNWFNSSSPSNDSSSGAAENDLLR